MMIFKKLNEYIEQAKAPYKQIINDIDALFVRVNELSATITELAKSVNTISYAVLSHQKALKDLYAIVGAKDDIEKKSDLMSLPDMKQKITKPN